MVLLYNKLLYICVLYTILDFYIFNFEYVVYSRIEY